MLYVIPIAIIITFLIKSISLYFTRIQSISISFKIKESIQKSLAEKFYTLIFLILMIIIQVSSFQILQKIQVNYKILPKQ